jgi:beta-N-acetylhexosaminidase
MAHGRAFVAFLLLVLSAYPEFMRSSKPKALPAKAVSPSTKAGSRSANAGTTSSADLSRDRAAVQRWLRAMTLHEKVAQLVVLTTYGEAPASRSPLFREYVHAVRDLKVGGLIVVNRVIGGTVRSAEPYAMAAFLNRMQRLAKVPLLVGADFERGASMRVSGTAKYPHQMAYGAAGDMQLTRSLGAATAREARAIGVHWVFAPVADVNSNPENPIINIRSFGENPAAVAAHVRAYIEGAHSDPAARVLVTAKHFPGHGDTSVDSHMGLAKLDSDRTEMDAVELVPFKGAIEADVDAVMTAHMAVPAVEDQDIPATVSRNVLTNLLRTDLRFPGLIVTDAMDMQGLTKQFPGGEAAVRAIEAGVDVLLMPPNAEAAIKAVVAAVRQGRLTEKRIEESTVRMLAAKARVGLARNKLVNLEAISDVIESAEFAEQAQLAADKAITLVKNDKSAVPLKNPDSACVYVLTESRSGQQGRRFIDEVQARSKNIDAILLDPQVSKVEMELYAGKAANCGTVVVAAFATVGAYRGNPGLGGEYPGFMQAVLKGASPVIMVALGSPYLLRSYPEVSSYIATFSPTVTAETAAAKALFGEIGMTGRLPVTIPGVAAYGDGIQLGAARQ